MMCNEVYLRFATDLLFLRFISPYPLRLQFAYCDSPFCSLSNALLFPFKKNLQKTSSKDTMSFLLSYECLFGSISFKTFLSDSGGLKQVRTRPTCPLKYTMGRFFGRSARTDRFQQWHRKSSSPRKKSNQLNRSRQTNQSIQSHPSIQLNQPIQLNQSSQLNGSS